MIAAKPGPTNRGWLRKWLRLQPHQIIGVHDNPYLLRWYVLPRNRWLNVYVHQFLRSDDDRALHDHPWWFISLILKGGYTEVTENGRTPRSGLLGGRYWRWDRQIAFRPARFRHRVELWSRLVETGRIPPRDPRSPLRFWREGEAPCWTLIVTGPRVREWGFWCPQFLSHGGLPTHRPYASDSLANPRDGERFVPWRQWGPAGCGEQ